MQPSALFRAPRSRRESRAVTSQQDPAPSLVFHVDGASRGNPGDAGFGVHARDASGSVTELYGYLGRTTNNVAEYQALLHALRFARKHGAARVEIFSDSELLVRQIKGEYRVRNAGLVPLHHEALTLMRGFDSALLTHVPRERNRDADRLANRAVDERLSQLE
jgi:ribonuclease HI